MLTNIEDEQNGGEEKLVVLPVVVELEEAKKRYTREEANKILEKLYKINKLNASELGIRASDEDTTFLSRRVHAWERIADGVPVWNKYPAFAPFETGPHLRFNFVSLSSLLSIVIFYFSFLCIYYILGIYFKHTLV